MSFTLEKIDESPVVVAHDSIFDDMVRDFDALLTKAEEDSTQRLLVDMRRVELLCSSGIMALVKHHVSMQGKGGKLVLIGCQPSVVRVLGLLGLQAIFSLVDSIDAAPTA